MINFLDGRTSIKADEASSILSAIPQMTAKGFQPLLQQEKMNGASEAVTESTAAGAGMNGHQHTAPQIELVKADGRIQRIIVTCQCGTRIELDCEY